MKPGALWPLAVAAVLALTVAANIWLLWKANDPDAMAMEPDYYQKAVAWDSTLAQERRNVTLGWRVDAALSPTAGGAVRVTLADAAGAPLAGARVTLAAIHNLAGGRFEDATLAERAPGVYAAALPLAHVGTWELRIAARRGAERFTSVLRRELPAGAR